MTRQPDDLDAVRELVKTLEPFKNEERERIIRWAKERLGMETISPPQHVPLATQQTPLASKTPSQHQPLEVTKNIDIKSFINEKNPSSDQQLAAIVAYYYQFEASDENKKESIEASDLLDACRQAGKARPKNPGQTLRNAMRSGLLDRAGDQGSFRLNAVGENLVAMVLPGKNGGGEGAKVSGVKKRKVKKKASKAKKTKDKKKRR